ncbi:hypothetical protein HFN63_36890 [Rhizobium leguminosarum]|uniref:hypothetical protein n=1 Tax=Rhizobium leguminosarum TaxID=384 RepID=UPI001C982734|nr:hypothetical protein [Rhizobium leguminosarum]MBY5775486.1 hypothetical protein [Rhizobium leguminosarum]
MADGVRPDEKRKASSRSDVVEQPWSGGKHDGKGTELPDGLVRTLLCSPNPEKHQCFMPR